MGVLEILFVIAGVLLIAVLFLVLRGDRSRDEVNRQLSQMGDVAERLSTSHAELSGRLQQSQRDMNDRLEALSKRMGDGLTQQTEKTGQTLKELHERLAIIDSAQQKITDLSQQVVGLQDILSNKQARGAFGELQLNDLVSSILPPSAYEFQVQMSNGTRADCLLTLPNPPGPIVIDSKFPLESYHAFRNAGDDETRQKALRGFGVAVTKHVKDISEKYIVPGETAESALMFLPSEAVYAELHASLPDVVERSYRAKVWIVSPTTLMATLNTVRAVLKDVHMREQAGVIQEEVFKMLEDVSRLDDRVGKLQRHMGQADDDLRQIRISTDKVTKRSERISEVEMGEDLSTDEITDPPRPRLVDNA
ncbi:MAG: DNA recombination protein RmuC [Rhodospirillaceae bacterium TMED167]|nr:DNA recombination protein RmuC [Rhodospirillaceae bacterium]OUW29624.1 MAG: DNA recombination protein RmuC [Rhodospirillaceae bacterium TMED167]